MTTYYTPIERTRLPADDPLRWFVHVCEAPHVSDARMNALAFVDRLPGRGHVVWASVRDCPSFDHMRELRSSMDACNYSRAPRRGKVPAVAGYV